MKTFLDCIPCFIRQALDAARMASSDADIHKGILKEVLQWAVDLDMNQSAPAMGQRIHRRIRELVGLTDPYRRAKDLQNHIALTLLPEIREMVTAAPDPLMMAVRLAIAGNVIDMGVNGNVTETHVRNAITEALSEPFSEEGRDFSKTVAEAKRILYLADNAGEIVFDRLLIEQLRPERVTVAVRGAPVINDATLIDARAADLDQIVHVIDNGSDAPGTLLDDCSDEFKWYFSEADLILAKGQGNFETLSETPKKIVFLFKVKCPVISKHAQVPLGTHVVRIHMPDLHIQKSREI